MAHSWYWKPGNKNFGRCWGEPATLPCDKEKLSFSSSESSTAENTSRCSVTPSRNIVDFFKRREVGLGIDNWEDEVVRLKASNWHDLETYHHAEEDFSFDVEFVKKGRSDVLVGWSDGNRTFVEEKQLDFPPVMETAPFFQCLYPPLYKTVDLCEIPNRLPYNIVMIVMSDKTDWKAVFRSKSNRTIPLELCFYDLAWVFCCTANDFSESFACGAHGYIFVCKPDQIADQQTRLLLGCQAHSIEFNKIGNLVFAGCNTGDIAMADLRDRDITYSTFHNTGIDETILLSDDNRLICGGFDGMLCCVDLRMRRPLFYFPGHHHTGEQKVPFSLDESNHLLCATGTDNITRLWNLETGRPIYYLEPAFAGYPCRSWLATNGYKFYIYQYQKSRTFVYENI